MFSLVEQLSPRHTPKQEQLINKTKNITETKHRPDVNLNLEKHIFCIHVTCLKLKKKDF